MRTQTNGWITWSALSLAVANLVSLGMGVVSGRESTVLALAPLAVVQSVRSPDGRAWLEIPDGALPSGVTIADISITDISAEARTGAPEENRPLAAYRLEPDGLEFNAPVNLTIRSQVTGSDLPIPMLLSVSGGTVEPLDDLEVEFWRETGTLEVRGTLVHFSTVVLAHGRHFRLSLDDVTDHAVGETFVVGASVAKTGNINMYMVGDVRWEVRFVGEAWDLNGEFRAQPSYMPVLSPRDRIYGHPGDTIIWPPTESYETQQSFTCVGPGTYSVGYWVHLVYSTVSEAYGYGDYLSFTYDPETVSVRASVYGEDAQCLAAPVPDAPPPSPTPTDAPPPAETPVPPDGTGEASDCAIGLALSLEDIRVMPGEYHEGVVRIRAVDRSTGLPLRGVRVDLEARRSDGQITRGSATTNEQGEATARMRTTAYGQNTLVVRQATSSNCQSPRQEDLPKLTWESRP
ncbi:MAG: Ig-like domain-containing protein [Chloroflexi bacterium]|nr:Ig-like domain-containing protein [Chloroflexota bacterium]